MHLSAKPVPLQDILRMRDIYRHEMNCQIIHDSIHPRPGWSQSYPLSIGPTPVGYAALAVSGPWKDKPTAYEFFVLPDHRSRVFDLFSAFLAAANPIAIETQSNDPLMTVMLHTFARNVVTESILFHDRLTTFHAQPGVTFRRTTPDDAAQIAANDLEADTHWLLELNGKVVATGGILFHYNRPYGDIYMKVTENLRRRGLGAYLVQELKRTCYEQGNIPAARCSPTNIPSRKTLQKAGFVPCAHILVGSLSPAIP